MKNKLDIVVISLIDDVERRKIIQEEFNKYQLDFEFFDAIYGKYITGGEYYSLCKNENFLFNRRVILSPGEVGCKLSHENVIRNFIYNSNSDWLVVLEDDISFKFDPRLLLSDLDNFDGNSIIHLGGQEGLSNSKRVVKYNKVRRSGYTVSKVCSITLRWLYRTCGYVMSREVAERVYSVYQSHNFVADDWRFLTKKANINEVLYCDVVRHPEDLSMSKIEAER
ncbi:Glycosyltransferase family 25 protein [Vibrio chagasii]|uniref:glycosyltransferase family 25 protein n=1 Tax=Vibrio chagasii TaxID=170679 RepID=UPI00337427E7|nr:Glycosyltransferase family 25 protein [Vibrio chagasii]CAH6933171.1 Glycosyltransferase family 25 protein [Vibrio chagasii]CAH7037684.1 Glycosyltransferase family 25 protein [Vibrio chagasii]CAH7062336.1 Glycosyltransferase family 25 protein [Vibrio chagasii]CAH7089839.1 Glycosyltransferase family 25 protein [Vibrio chagasii]